MDEQRIAAAKASVTQIYSMLHGSPSDWANYVVLARAVIAALDTTSFMRMTNRPEEQIWLVNGLQQLAYHDPDSGGISDIADWCLRQWLTVLQAQAQDLRVYKGLGQNWLWKAQAALARIHIAEGGSSSSSGGSQGRAVQLSSSEEERLSAIDAARAEARIHTADYVEARGILVPATEYFARAVQLAYNQNAITGDILELAAEASMSLGNVSSPRSNEHYFQQAIVYLRAAAALPEYSLSPYMHQYLEDYGRLVQ